jgi:hypothetical protein
MHQPARQTAVTHRDGEAPRVVASFREEVATRVLALPRRKRYTINLDLDAKAPPDAEPSAPGAALDI